MKLNEELFDDIISVSIPNVDTDIEISEEDLEPTAPLVGEDMGAAELLIQAINNTWDTISMYNSIIATIPNKTEIVDVVNDILNELNTQVGKLEKTLETVSPNAANIDAGEMIADEDEIEEEPIEDYTPICSTSTLDRNVTIPDCFVDPVKLDNLELMQKRINKFRKLVGIPEDADITADIIDDNINDFNKVAFDFNTFPEKFREELLGNINK